MNIVISNITAVLPDNVKHHCNLIINGKQVAAVKDDRSSLLEMAPGTPLLDGTNLIVFPGFIDLHIHGGGGADFMDATETAIEKIIATHTCHGTTGILATTMTEDPPRIKKAISAARSFARSKGNQLLGIHLEGPFVSHEFRGAQPAQYLQEPAVETLDTLVDDDYSLIRMLSYAPELKGTLAFTQELLDRNIIPSIAHTGATYEQCMTAIGAGMRHATHMFNGMLRLHHRQPGTVGAILDDPDTSVQLIADCIHIHPAVMRLLYRVKGPEKIVLITDAMQATGLQDGEYTLAGQKVTVTQGKATLEDGTLAGSTLTLDRAVKNMVNEIGCDLPAAAKMASLNAATLLGINDKKGSIMPGKDADLVIMNKDFQVTATMVQGEFVFAQDEIKKQLPRQFE